MRFVYMAVVRVSPEQVTSLQQVLNGEQGRESGSTVHGLTRAHLLESLDEPGKLIWLTCWKRQADFREMVSSPQYAARLARIRPCLLAEPEWYGYRELN